LEIEEDYEVCGGGYQLVIFYMIEDMWDLFWGGVLMVGYIGANCYDY
jgi:hypothetical protein